MNIKTFQNTILTWYLPPNSGRRDMPWRETRNPYNILVSEIMLQQTQVSRVLPKYKEFLQNFPTPQTLAKASDKKLLRVWSGLGYWRRAKYLKETAKTFAKTRESSFQASPRRPASMVSEQSRGVAGRERRVHSPAGANEARSIETWTPEHLQKLPGIGSYTARALACFAFGSKEAFLDTNIRRVYLYFFFPRKKQVADKDILSIAQQAIDTLPKHISPREWHYALFDYGALVLKDNTINKQSRHYAKQSTFQGSFRSYRTKALRFILAAPKSKVSQKELWEFLRKELKNSSYTPKEIVSALLKDNLIKESGSYYFL